MHGLLVGEQRLLGARLLGLDTALVAPGIEQRRDDAKAGAPEIRATVGERGKVITLESQRAGQGERRPASRLGDADACSLSSKFSLGGEHVGTPLQEF